MAKLVTKMTSSPENMCLKIKLKSIIYSLILCEFYACRQRELIILTPGNLEGKFVSPNSPSHNTPSMGTEAGATEGHCLLVCSGPLRRTQHRPTCLGMAPPILWEILLHQLTIQKTPHRPDRRPI